MSTMLHIGDKGEMVRALQTALNEFGAGLRVDGDFGELTEVAVMRFQRSHDLVPDGIPGPITWAVLRPDVALTVNALRSDTRGKYIERVILTAQQFVGLRETGGDNRGPQIEKWLLECGIDFPAAWCVAAVQGCFSQAARELNVQDPLKPNTAGVLDLWNRVPDEWKHDKNSGRRGDIIIFDWGNGTGHAGIVTDYASGYYSTIEGNTNDAGGRDGDCMAVKNRYKYNDRIRGFIRVPDPLGK